MSTATRTSRQIERTVFDWVSWFVASARTVTASVWVPALPPIEATIGIKIASATMVSIAAPNWAMMKLATIAVPRLAMSQRTRAL